MRNILRAVIPVLILLRFTNLQAQPGCPAVSTATNVSVPCGQTCVNLTATAFGGATTTSYAVSQIPYAPPFPFNSGTAVLVHTDDLWSSVINLPFNFCFYGNTFSSAIIGSNGCISFNTVNAGLTNNWAIPAGGAPFTGETDMRNSIMAPWQDLDPTNAGDIYYNVGGTAPCRYLEVSWYHCPMYGDPNSVNTSYCTTSYSQTQMAVIYETSNAIEVYIQQKGTPCTGWNSGYAVEGLMNGAGTLATVVPGRNATVWGPVSNDAYRFMPSGAPNYTIAWFQGATQIGTGSPIQVCPTTATTYTASATYTNCDNSTITVTSNVFVGLASLTVSDSARQITCNNANNGAVFANFNSTSGVISYGWSPGGAGQTTLNNIGPGTYIFTVHDSAGCVKSDTEILVNPALLVVNVPNDTANSCTGTTNNGYLATDVTGGTPTYSYAWSPGGATTKYITGLNVGSYSVTVTDSHGCTGSTSANVSVITHALTFASPQITNVSCFGGSTGQIIAPVNGGSNPITYTWSAGNSTTDTLSNLTAGTYTVTAVDVNGCSATASFNVTQATAVVALVANDTVISCSGSTNNGTLTASASGGTPGYTYSWTGGSTTNPVTGLAAGNYTVIVTDLNGCTASASAGVSVITRSIIFGTPQITNVSCLGGSNGQIIANVIGGTNPITYTWSAGTGTGNTLSNLSAGTYTVTAVDAGGCSATATYNITQPATGIVVTVPNDTITSCTGQTNIGILTANVSGGTPVYSFTWTNAATTNPITGLATGTYTVTVSDVFGCSATGSGNVVVKTSSLNITGVVANPICSGLKGEIIITVTGGVQPYTYNWNPGFSTTDTLAGIGGGTYNVTVTDVNGCSATASFTVSQPAPMIVRVPNDTVITCSGVTTNGTLTASTTGGTPGYNYVWSNTATTATITGLSAGTYLVTATDRVGCTAAGAGSVIVIGNPVAFNAPQITNAGCSGAATGQIILSTTGGTAPITFTWSGGTTQNDTLRNLAGGTYNITATDVTGCSATAVYTISQSAPIVFGNPVITNVGCNGGNNGAISATATGGTGTIHYAWSNGFTTSSITNLAAGSYVVTATDSLGCTAEATYTVGQSAPIAIDSAIVDGVSCSGNGSILVTASGGTGTLTYAWTGGLTGSSITNLAAGGYTVTVTDINGCSATAYYIVGHSSCGGCPAVNTNNNVTIPCSQTCTNLMATAFSAAQTTSYTVGPIPYNPPFAFNTGTPILVATDDLWSGIINLPFNFCFFGVVHNQILVGSNGEVSFNTSNANAFENWSIPGAVPFANPNTEADQKNTIMGAWQDLDPTLQGNIYYNITGTAPCRKFEVSWYRSPMFGDASSVDNGYCDTTDHQTQMIVLYETTNAIDIYIQNKDIVCNNLSGGTYWNGGLAIEGIVNPTGTVAYTVPGRDATQWTATNDAWRFTPAGAPNFTVAWYQGGNLIGSSDTISVCPIVPTTYTVLATYTNCDNSQVIVGDSVFVTPGGSLTVNIDSTHNILCNGDSDGAVYASYDAHGGIVTSFGWTPGGANQTSLVNIPAGTYIFTVTTTTCTKSDTVVLVNPSRVVVNVANDTFSSCTTNNLGTLVANASGGTPGYTYSWSNGATTDTISGLTPGTYFVTVTDSHGCTGSATATVTRISGNLTFNTPQVTNATCSVGGSIIVGVIGGTLPVTYEWSPSEPNTDTLRGLVAGSYCVTATDAGGCSVSTCLTVTQPSAVTIDSATVKNLTCNGAGNGSIFVYAHGGTPPLTYSWTPGNFGNIDSLTSLAAGSYGVTVTDSAGCSASASYTITQPSAIGTDSVSIVNVTCTASGSILVIDTGGVAPLHYAWSGGQTTDSITNVPAGTYTLTVTDAHGCSITASYNVGTAPGAVAFGPPVIVNTSCHGDSTGSITVSATGGQGNISFVWSTGATTATVTGLSVGNYCVTATDTTSCSASACYNIIQPTAVTFGASVITNVTCNAGTTGSITATATGGTGTITFNWSNGATGNPVTGLEAGVYCVTATDSAGCSASICYNVSQPAPIVLDSAHITSITCVSSGQIILFVSGGIAPYTYSWSVGQTGDTATVTTAGTVGVTVTDANGCSVTGSYTVAAALGAVTIGTPVISNVTCNGNTNGSITAVATDSLGGPITFVWSNGATGATITGLSVGNYCVTATDSLGCSASACYNITQPAAITFGAPVIVSPTCNGNNNGSITVNAGGGTGTITYSWGPNITGATDSGLIAGTYSVTATDSLGCSATASYTITQPAAITFGNSVVDSVTCNGASTGSINLAVSGGTGTLGYGWSSGATTALITGLSAGTYCVTVTDSVGCSASTCFTLNQLPLLVIDTAVIHEASCVTGGSVVITVSGGTGVDTYSWSSNPSVTDSAGNVAAGNITVIVTDHNGCSVSATYLVPAAPNTVVIDSAIITNVTCHGGNTGSITVVAGGGIGSLHYAWGSPPGGATATISGLTAASYTVTVTDSLGCSASAQYTVTQPAAIVIDSIVSHQVTCTNQGSLVVHAHGGTGALTYTWPNSNVTIDSLGGLNAGTYTITVTDQSGCSITTTGTVGTAPNSIVLSFNSVPPTCFGLSNGSVTVTATGGVGGYTYLWSNQSTTNSITGLTAGIYCVVVHDANGCSKSACDTLTQPAQLVITSFTNVNATCSTLGSMMVVVSGGTTPYGYLWSNFATTNPVTGLNGGSIDSVVVHDAHGCLVTGSDTLAPAPVPLTIVEPLVVNVICYGGNTGSISVATSGGTGGVVYFHWSNGDSTATITGLVAGTYIVTASNVGGVCPVTDTFVVTQPGVYSASITAAPVVCPGANDTATVNVTGGAQPLGYHWTQGQTTQVVSITGLTTSGTVESVTVTDNNGCSTVATDTVKAAAQIVAHAVVSPHPCSAGAAVVITATGGAGALTYNYTPGGTANGTGQFTIISAGPYTYTVTDALGCFVSDTFSVPVTIPASVDTSISDSASCFGFKDGSITVFIVQDSLQNAPFTYSINGGAFGSSHVFDSLGAGTYQIVVKNDRGCLDTLLEVVGQPAQLMLSFSPDTILGVANFANQLTPTILNAINPVYSWTPTTGLNCSTCADPTATVSAPTLYYLTVSDSLNTKCAVTDSVLLLLKGPLVMPDAFSPNGDGKNDFFGPVSHTYVIVKEFHIYNRWGQLVHNSTSPWDGKFDGKEQPSGTYIYYIEGQYEDPANPGNLLTGKQQGAVTLLR